MAEIRTATEPRHEADTINLRGILYFAVALAVLALVVHVVLWFMASGFAKSERESFPELTAVRKGRPTDFEERLKQIPEPRLQEKNEPDLIELRAKEAKVLTTYGYSDPKAKTIRIPIDEAMKILADPKLAERAGVRSLKKEAKP
jgi:hypothetical protein